MKFTARAQAVEAVKWTKYGDHPRVRTPAGAAPGVYRYGIVDTPQGPKPIEPGDYLVIDAAGNAAPWRPEHFEQVFIAADVAEIPQPKIVSGVEALLA